MREEYLTRQSDLIPQNILHQQIIIVGAGAIGSFTTLSLAKMGFRNIKVYDYDIIEDENMNCQFYPISEIGNKKVHALQRMVKEFTGVVIEDFDMEVNDHFNFVGAYLICAVDSMSVRKMLFEKCWNTSYLIDPRMSAEYAMIETLYVADKGERFESYEATLYTDDDAVQERCTAKATMYTVMLIAGQISKIVKDTSLYNNYLRTIDWNIENNQIFSWDNEGVRK